MPETGHRSIAQVASIEQPLFDSIEANESGPAIRNPSERTFAFDCGLAQ
jgi:hypothetical protein